MTPPPKTATDPAALQWHLNASGDGTTGEAAPAGATPQAGATPTEGTLPAPAGAPADAGAGSGNPAGGEAAVPLRRNRDFSLLWGGAGLSLLAGRATAVAYPLTVLWLTGSPGDAGLVGTALLLPQLLVQLPGGALVDRWDRRRIMLGAGLGQALVAGAVAALLLSGHVWLWALLAAAFVEGTLGVLHQLAERAAVPAVVPAEQLPAALTGNEARTRGAAIAGQPLGSGLVALGASFPYVAALVGQLASVALLFGVRGKLQTERTGPRPDLLADVKEGLVWMWRQHFLRAVMAAVAVSNLLFQGLNLAVMTGIQENGGSQFEIGLVLSLSGAGGLVGAISGGWWATRFSLRTLVLGGLAVWTALMVPVAVLRDPFALGALFAASGYVGGVFNVAGGVFMVRVAPDRMRGRANSLAMLVGGGAMAAGPVAAGFALEAYGPVRTVLGLSAAMGLTALAALLSPALRRNPLEA
ncbi:MULTISPECIES: MFS transporter [Streptomyces]|uniref:MFS transporter n=1 Tax=Streptomyces TaxID=1883 RepID=UPI0021AEA2EE|nr:MULTISPECIES: MFS transporter [Streptomyces]GLX21350.1 MFS transporter [Streptomyces lavendulae subsp. lavendulae]GLX27868.1 MFS transporter [Streptomyces lavendulae subsp. lavendulae]